MNIAVTSFEKVLIRTKVNSLSTQTGCILVVVCSQTVARDGCVKRFLIIQNSADIGQDGKAFLFSRNL